MVIWIDMGVVLFFVVLLVVFVYIGCKIVCWEGGILFVGYFFYMGLCFDLILIFGG